VNQSVIINTFDPAVSNLLEPSVSTFNEI